MFYRCILCEVLKLKLCWLSDWWGRGSPQDAIESSMLFSNDTYSISIKIYQPFRTSNYCSMSEAFICRDLLPLVQLALVSLHLFNCPYSTSLILMKCLWFSSKCHCSQYYFKFPSKMFVIITFFNVCLKFDFPRKRVFEGEINRGAWRQGTSFLP